MAAGSGVELRQEIQGLRELQRETERIVRELHGEPMLNGMRRATLLVQTSAKRLAPVDTGRLRSSITPEIREESRRVIGVVGSNVIYAPYMETGTRPHWPPEAALEVWAKRHGTTAYIVARSIARKGTKARPYLQPAFDQNKERIQTIIGETVRGIIKS